jgi:fructose-bisphosphate aldolase, class II
MTVATLAEVLRAAQAGNYAVAGVVVLGWEDAKAYMEAAEECRLPIILQAGPGCRQHTPLSILGKIFRHLAEGATVPVVCHIDHATTVEECRQGIEHGFSSVMIDGSRLSLQENIALTSEVVALAKTAGVSVEGEIGFVGYDNGTASSMTKPQDAAAFETGTGVDALAISIGNVHLQTTKQAIIDFEILSAIEAVTTKPLVLHGGSGIAVDVRQVLATQHRIKKFNIGTELRTAFGEALRETLAANPHEFDRNKILNATIPASRNAAIKVLQNLGAPTLFR